MACECGCGQPTRIATRNDRSKGHVKGQPFRFMAGHNLRRDRAAQTEPPAEAGPEVRRCRQCKYPVVPQGHRPPPGWRAHNGRCLCEWCYKDADAAGELVDFERTTRSRDEVLDEWLLLREQGCSRAQAAERLGMTFDAFDRAWRRARKAGDERALPALDDMFYRRAG